ncbi:hypothetical protein CJU89_6614 [Yarrowia sp. B02]|nr:hypothetical protein CJU89_6614 [Yarrowia sp. B02]
MAYDDKHVQEPLIPLERLNNLSETTLNTPEFHNVQKVPIKDKSWFTVKRFVCISVALTVLVLLTFLFTMLTSNTHQVIDFADRRLSNFEPKFSPLTFSGEEDVSAVACVDFSPPKNHPQFESWTSYWSPKQASYSDMIFKVWDAVEDAARNDDKDLRSVYLDDVIAVRVPHALTTDNDFPHLKEAVVQVMQAFDNEVYPDAYCVVAHDSTGASVAFVWGYNGNKVASLECSVAPENYCLVVDKEYFETYPDRSMPCGMTREEMDM